MATGFSCRIILKITREGFENYVLVPLTALFPDPHTEELNVFVYDETTQKLEKTYGERRRIDWQGSGGGAGGTPGRGNGCKCRYYPFSRRTDRECVNRIKGASMNLPKYSLEHTKVIYFFLAIMLIGGIISFFKLPKKEDAPFVIKQAVLITQYPGATSREVEKLVTEPIEREIQSMSEVKQIKSESYFGLSKITIELKPTIKGVRMPVKWDELRRKVLNIQSKLPQGASSITVNDDFGDVYGIYYALTIEEGFSYKELRDWAQKIKTELTPIEGVQKVQLFGEQTEVVNVLFSVPKLSALGIDPNTIAQVLQTQNLQVNTGEINAGSYQLKVLADGTYKSLDDIRNQLIITKGGNEVQLGGIAAVERGYLDPPSNLMRVDGKKAIGIGVASGAEDDVVAVGNLVAERLQEIKKLIPVGMDLVSIYPENIIAQEANNGFILNLIESLLIVIAIIFIVMGARAGMLIGSSRCFP